MMPSKSVAAVLLLALCCVCTASASSAVPTPTGLKKKGALTFALRKDGTAAAAATATPRDTTGLMPLEEHKRVVRARVAASLAAIKKRRALRAEKVGHAAGAAATGRNFTVDPHKTLGELMAARSGNKHARSVASMFASYGQYCPDGTSYCQAGSFCINSVVCLAGSPADYTPPELLTVGAVSKLVSDEMGVEFSCLRDIGATFEDLFQALTIWDNAGSSADAKSAAMPHLKSAVNDLSAAFKDCAAVAKESFWDRIWGWIKDAIAVFFPEVKAIEMAYEILVNGVDLFEDFDDMLTVCNIDSPEVDFIACGSDMGDITARVYDTVSS